MDKSLNNINNKSKIPLIMPAEVKKDFEKPDECWICEKDLEKNENTILAFF